jgi:hypothetical protein
MRSGDTKVSDRTILFKTDLSMSLRKHQAPTEKGKPFPEKNKMRLSWEEVFSMARYKVGIDVGGTFTDLTAVDMKSGKFIEAKVPSTPGDFVRIDGFS